MSTVVPFWRGWRAGFRMPMAVHPERPAGTRTIMLWDDGNGPRPVTEIDWAMLNAFNRFDDIVRAAHSQFDKLLTKENHGRH